MTKQKHSSVFARVVCVSVRSGIIVALYLAAFLAALQLAAVLTELWSAVGITALVLITGLSVRGKWPGRRVRLESVGLGYQPDAQLNSQSVAPAPSRDVPVRSRAAFDVVFVD